MVKRKITNHLAVLQSKMKKDPDAYIDEFLMQFEHLKATLKIFTSYNAKWNEELAELLLFIAHVSEKYPKFGNEYVDLLESFVTSPTMNLCPMRSVMLNCLMLLRRRNRIEPDRLYKILFFITRRNEASKSNYKIARKFIIRDIQLLRKNNKSHDGRLQFLLSEYMRSPDIKASLLAIDIVSELFRKEVWMDENVVNEISYCCFSKLAKVRLRALKFFLGIEDIDDDDDDESDDEQRDKIKQVLLAHRVGKKTNNRAKKKEKLIRAIKRKNIASNSFQYDTYKLRLLRDPQGFCERLYQNLDKCADGYHVKMMLQDLISRLIGVNSLILLNFYPNIQRYLNPRQPEVTKILLFAAQATHDLVPPDVINEMTKCIAVNFINESNTPESITVGLNALREICRRCPFALADHIVEDLGSFRSFKDKNVSAAARSLINVLRQNNPSMLPRKLRTKPTEDQQILLKDGVKFGDERVLDIIPGAEILVKKKKSMTDDVLHSKTVKLMSTKIFTDEQLEAIKSEQLRRAVNLIGQKQHNSSDSEDDEDLPTLESIEQFKLTAKEKINRDKALNKEDAAGITKKTKFQKKRKQKGGLSNKAKKNMKLFAMMKHKYKSKNKRSLKEKQVAQQQSILKQKRRRK